MWKKLKPFLPSIGLALMNWGLDVSGISNRPLAIGLWSLAAIAFIAALPIGKYFRRKPMAQNEMNAMDTYMGFPITEFRGVPMGWEAVSGKTVFEFVGDVATKGATFSLQKIKKLPTNHP